MAWGVTVVVAFIFLPQNYGRWQGPMICTLSFYECRLSRGDTQRCWGYSNRTCCNPICLNFFHSEALGGCYDMHFCPLPPARAQATCWNFHYLIFFLLFTKIWKFTIWMSFKIVDCIIIHVNPDVEMEYFCKITHFWLRKPWQQVSSSDWMQPVLVDEMYGNVERQY